MRSTRSRIAFYPGEAQELSWTADRAGDWMFHCHIDDHISRHAPLRDMRAHTADPHLTISARFHLANEPMSGMVIAVKRLSAPRRLRAVAAQRCPPRELARSTSGLASTPTARVRA